MLSPLESFLTHELSYNPSYEINIHYIEGDYEVDSSLYNIVDNEEMDNGIQKYSKNGVHLCSLFRPGGDSYYYTYTQDGLKHFKELAKQIFLEQLENIK